MSEQGVIKIGTRSSKLALWQSNLVKQKLEDFGYKVELVEISTKGDSILNIPIHEIGGYGVFTRAIDNAMLKGNFDIAVHSLKDVPTTLPEGITQVAVLERGSNADVLVFNNNCDFLDNSEAIVATGSLRRKAFWLNKYPAHNLAGLRGNVNTRLQKLKDNNWDGAIFAKAGLERINVLPKNHLILDWMTPAPAQGAIVVTALTNNKEIIKVCANMNDAETEQCVFAERQFMKTLEGGCTAPIGALATIEGNSIRFKGTLLSIDGKQKIEVEKTLSKNKWNNIGELCAGIILNKGGDKLMKEIKCEIQ